MYMAVKGVRGGVLGVVGVCWALLGEVGGRLGIGVCKGVWAVVAGVGGCGGCRMINTTPLRTDKLF